MATAQTPNGDDTQDVDRSLKQRIEDRIERVDKGVRTPDRDDAAREILRWQARGGWPLNGPEMAERGEFSPQHYRNTIQWFSLDEDGFHNESTGESIEGGEHTRSGIDIEIPSDVQDVRAYARGYLAGYLDGREQ